MLSVVVVISVLVIVLAIVSTVCWIMVLIRMFGQSILTGILGLLCSLYALIWGFMNMDAAGLRTVMFVWTVSLVAGIGSQIAFVVLGLSLPGLPPPPLPTP